MLQQEFSRAYFFKSYHTIGRELNEMIIQPVRFVAWFQHISKVLFTLICIFPVTSA